MIVRANKRPQDVYWLQAAVSRHYDTPDSFVRSIIYVVCSINNKKDLRKTFRRPFNNLIKFRFL